MPELPEVETVVRCLRSALSGFRIRGVRCHFAGVVAGDSDEFCRQLAGRRFAGFERHGKYIFFALSGDTTVALHLRMTGQLFLAESDRSPDRHTHVEIFLERHERKLVYRDVRKFGRFALAPQGVEGFVRDKGLGPDALAVTPLHLAGVFGRTSRGIKAVLLEQRALAGLGNIYTDEILFRAGLAPWRRADSLSGRRVEELCGHLHQVLHAAIAASGTTISDYVDLDGRGGSFQFSLQVYGRTGQACRRCGARIQRRVVAGRGTWFCSTCQG